jgi:hypothetical protein
MARALLDAEANLRSPFRKGSIEFLDFETKWHQNKKILNNIRTHSVNIKAADIFQRIYTFF